MWQGEVGISRMDSEDMSPEMKRAPPAWTKPPEEEGSEGSPQGIRRRLSVRSLFMPAPSPGGDASGDEDGAVRAGGGGFHRDTLAVMLWP